MKNRLQKLDFVRGIAILLVLFTHFKWVDVLYQVGWIGVDLFFVLSGFLVSGLLFKEYQKRDKINVARFLVRRGFKIYPMFYLFIAVSVWIGQQYPLGSYDTTSGYFGGVSRSTFFPEIFFFQNYKAGMWINTWSLAVEEHFYFVIAILFGILASKAALQKPNIIPGISLFIMLVCLVLRIENNLSDKPYYYITHMFPTHLRADSLMVGVLLSYYYHYQADRFKAFFSKNRFVWLFLALVLLSPAFFFDIKSTLINTAGLSFIYLGFALLLGLVLSLKNFEVSAKKILSPALFTIISKIGIYSYGIYIWHLFVKHYGLYLIRQIYHPQSQGLEFIIYFVLSVGVGILMSILVEQPILKLRNKWIPSSKTREL